MRKLAASPAAEAVAGEVTRKLGKTLIKKVNMSTIVGRTGRYLLAICGFGALLAQTFPANAVDACRIDARAADTAAQEYRRAARDTSRACTKDAQVDCASALLAAESTLVLLEDAHLTMLESCAVPVPPTVPPTAPGELVITEIMANPNAVSDSAGEWFEIFNNTANFIDIQGINVSDDAFDVFTVGSSVVISPFSYVVLGRNDDPNVNGGVIVDFEYSNFVLGNAGDEIEIEFDSVSIDRVDYAGFTINVGKAMNLDIDKLDAVLNDIAINWCSAISLLPGGDTGTPGADNEDCP